MQCYVADEADMYVVQCYFDKKGDRADESIFDLLCPVHYCHCFRHCPI